MSQLQVTGEAKIRDIQGPVVSNSGVISALNGNATQYVRGDGTLADFPTSTGGGSSVSYYLNSSVSQGTIGGVAYRQLGKTPIAGAGTDIVISSNGYVASYLTDANDPALLEVPAGNFNCEFYFSVNNNTGNPFVYAEVYKYDGTTFTLIGTSVGVPEYINQGTVINPYYFAVPVAQSVLTVTDRIAIRIYVNVDGRTVTLHTENNHLCQVVTTFSKGLISLNNLTRQNQFFATGTSGTDFGISSSVATHTFNLPVASATNTGKLSSTDWSTFNNKVPYTGATSNVDLGTNSIGANTFLALGNGTSGGFISFTQTGTLAGISTGVASIGSVTAGQLSFYYGNNLFASIFSNTSLSATRTFTLPDLSGTLALLEAENKFTLVNSFDQSINYKTDAVLVGISGYISQAYAKSGSGASSILSMKIADGSSVKNISLDFIGSAVTTPYSYLFPAFSGTMALLEGTQTFTGDKLFNGSVDFNNSVNINSGLFIRNNVIGSTLYTSFTITKASSTQTLSYLFSTAFASNLLFNDAANYSYTFPTASGTIALTSNLSAYVPYTGATANVNLGVYDISVSGIKVESNVSGGTAVNIKQNSSTLIAGAGYISIGAKDLDTLLFHYAGATNSDFKAVRLKTTNIPNTSSRVFEFPNADGTLALTSNLSAYLPLTGGTLTGALSGTSATFVSTSAINNAARYNISIGDNSAVASGNGGGILFRGVFTGSTLVDAAAISSYKLNGTDGDYAYGLSFITRANGGDLTSRLVITPSGNVGIGTSSPLNKLDIVQVGSNNAVAGVGLKVVSDAGNPASIALSQTGRGTVTIGMAAAGAAPADFVLGTDVTGNIIFKQGLTGTYGTDLTTGNERMRITSGGEVCINQTSVEGQLTVNALSRNVTAIRLKADTGSAAISISGTGSIRVDYPGVGAGRLELNDAGTLFLRQYGNGTVSIVSGQVISTSNINLKNDDGGIDNALSKVLKLNPRYFYWKEDSGIDSNERQLGFYAQEVKEALGEEVANDNGNGKWGVSDRGIIAMLTKAMQEQQAQIEELSNKIVALESK